MHQRRLPAPAPPKEVACKVGVKRGGERRGKGGEIGERRRAKSFSPPPSTFLCMVHRLGYQRNDTHTKAQAYHNRCWGLSQLNKKRFALKIQKFEGKVPYVRVLLLEMVNLPFGMRPKAAAQPQQSGYLNDNEAVVKKLIHSFIHSCLSVKTLFYFGLQSSIQCQYLRIT